MYTGTGSGYLLALFATLGCRTISVSAKYHKPPPNRPIGEEPDHNHICYVDFCTKSGIEHNEMLRMIASTERFTGDASNENAARVLSMCENNGVLNWPGPWLPNPCENGAWHGWWFADGCPPCASLNHPSYPETAYLKPHKEWDPVDKMYKTINYPDGTLARTVFLTEISG